jgi:hypothetical protein
VTREPDARTVDEEEGPMLTTTTTKTTIARRLTTAFLAASVALLVGCQGRPTLFPNPDPTLRKTSTQLAADAARRFPYKAEAPHETAVNARAQVAYSLNRLEVVNFSGEEWTDVEVWVNRKYVCHVPKMEDRKLKEVHFPMLYDETGAYFPFDNKQTRVETVELFRDGTVYSLTVKPTDY